MTDNVFTIGDAEPVFFVIQGKTVEGRPFEPERFDCVAGMSTRKTKHMMSLMKDDNNDDDVEVFFDGVVEFLVGAVVPSQRERFQHLLDHDDVLIDFPVLIKISEYLLGKYMTFQEAQPTTPSVGQSPTPTTSRVNLS